jgi:phosphoribosyl 1,2-cyclic phosphate phosphodiesterase
MQITFLGTGTSHGIPMIGCNCNVCTSTNLKNKRRRCSLYVISNRQHIIIDTPPDFREQVLTFGVKRVDTVLLTHLHADHIFGFDDIRRFSGMHQKHIPVYGSPDTIKGMRIKFDYVDQPSHSFSGVPRVHFKEMINPIELEKTTLIPLPVLHGTNQVYGYLIDSGRARLGYIPDCNAIPASTLALLEKMDVMILDGLRPKKHATHFSIGESVEALKIIGAKHSFITHLTHDSDHDTLQQQLGTKVTVPWDGMSLELS